VSASTCPACAGEPLSCRTCGAGNEAQLRNAAILALCNADYALAEPTWAIPTDAIRDILEPQNAALARGSSR